MDIVSKVVSIFVNVRLQKLMKIRGLPFQFGATPKLGCQDAVFALKAFLQERREKMLDTWVVFIDLIKACDSVQHRVIDATLEIFGVPTDVRSWVRRLHDGSTLEINVGKTKKIITYGCGVKQGDCLAPILFIMVMQTASSEVEVEFKKQNIEILDVHVSTSALIAALKNTTSTTSVKWIVFRCYCCCM